MFRKISDSIQYPLWVKDYPRYKRLDLLDRLLDGTFYDHLDYAFYDETDQQGKYIALADRRPCAQYRLPGMISKSTARKLFAGRHRPRFHHPDESVVQAVQGLALDTDLWECMIQATVWGSTGSVAVTFRISGENVRLDVWRAKWCIPTFSELGALSALRVFYTTQAANLYPLGFTTDNKGEKLDPGCKYWFIRDYTDTNEITYAPIEEGDWDPTQMDAGLHVKTELKHGLGTCPAWWFQNLSGGISPDGACTWDAAIPNSIEMDYTLSQLGRGVRYNSAPELVITGQIKGGMDSNGRILRGPTNVLQLEAAKKYPDFSVDGGDAKLLEMQGNGINVGLSYIDKLRKLALESIAAARKDPEQAKGPLSGKAMELVEEDQVDLINELRTCYGESGLLPLVKKILQAAITRGCKFAAGLTELQVSDLQLAWSRMYVPNPQETLWLVQAMQLATQTGSGAPGPDGAPVQMAAPLIDPALASRYLAEQLDLDEPGLSQEGGKQANVPPEGSDDVPAPDAELGGEESFDVQKTAPRRKGS